MADDVRDVLEELGITITAESHSGRTGQLHYHALCPYHYGGTEVDHDPSWDINAETGAHYCHACGFGGSLEWLVHKVSGTPLADAARVTRKGARAVRRVRRMDPWGGERPLILPPMNESRVKMYGRPPEWALEKRRLTAEVAEQYDIRWADHFIHGIEQRIDYPDCWITPIRQPDNFTAIGMQVKQEGQSRFFRNLPASVNKGSTLFGVETVTYEPVLYVPESPLDAAYLRTLGYPAVGAMGSHLTWAQMEWLIGHTDCIVFCLDNDKAGRQGSLQVLGRTLSGRVDLRLQDYSMRVEIRFANYEDAEGKDPGDNVPDAVHMMLGTSLSALRMKRSA